MAVPAIKRGVLRTLRLPTGRLGGGRYRVHLVDVDGVDPLDDVQAELGRSDGQGDGFAASGGAVEDDQTGPLRSPRPPSLISAPIRQAIWWAVVPWCA